MSVSLNDTDRRYIIRLLTLIREATQTCSAASEAWNKANDEFNDWYQRQHPNRVNTNGKPRDPVHYVGIKKVNQALIDAEASWSHWQREVERLTAAMNAELVARQLLGGQFIDPEQDLVGWYLQQRKGSDGAERWHDQKASG